MKKESNEAGIALGVMMLIIIGLIIMMGYDTSSTNKKMENACNNKAGTIKGMEGCRYFNYNRLTYEAMECLCIKDNEVKRFVLQGEEIPK